MLALNLIAAMFSGCAYYSIAQDIDDYCDTVETCFNRQNNVHPSIMHVIGFVNGGISWIESDNDSTNATYFVNSKGRYLRTIRTLLGVDKIENGPLRIIVGKKYGFADSGLKITIRPQWDYATAFEAGFANVCVNCWLEFNPNNGHSRIRESDSTKFFKINTRGDYVQE